MMQSAAQDKKLMTEQRRICSLMETSSLQDMQVQNLILILA